MNYDIARQPFVPAFFTLLAIALIAVWSLDPSLPAAPDAQRIVAAGPEATETKTTGTEAAVMFREAAEAAFPVVGHHAADRIETSADSLNAAASADCTAPNSASADHAVPNLPDAAPESVRNTSVAAPAREAARNVPASVQEPPLAIPTLRALLARIQTDCPATSRCAAFVLLLFCTLSTGRTTVRYNLYAVSSCLAIPLCAAILATMPADSEYLTAFVAATLTALILKNCARSFRNGYSFDAAFRAALYLGLLLVLLPAALPLLVLLPVAMTLFRRTLREMAVALFGVLLPGFTFAYVNWAAGGDFTAALLESGRSAFTGTPLGLLHSIPVPLAAAALPVALFDLAAAVPLLSDRSIGTKQRFILLFNIGILLCALLALCMPGATPALFALAAVPSAVLIPMLLVRIRRPIALVSYLILLAGAVAKAVLQ